MRALIGLSFLAVAGCSTLPHALDDLSGVHLEAGDSLEHRFQVERFSSFGGFLRFGPIGQMMGPWRHNQRVKEDLADPAQFCLERVQKLGRSGPGSGLYALEAVVWSGRILLSDPYSLSRLFAAEALGKLGKDFVDESAWARSTEEAEGGYADRVKRLATELTALAALLREGKGTTQDGAKLRQNLSELAAQRYAKTSESLAMLRLFLNVASQVSSERAACEEAGKHLAARMIPRLLLAGLRDPNEFVREASLASIHDLAGHKALAEIFRTLSVETSVSVRRRLAKLCAGLSLSQAASAESGGAIDFLLRSCRDADGSLAASAMESLSRILGIEARYDREFWKAWGEEYHLHGSPPPVRS